MKAAIIGVILITGIILFGFLTNFMAELNATTTWTAMNASAWETGLVKIAVPFSMLGFGIYLVVVVFKGRPDNRDGRPPE